MILKTDCRFYRGDRPCAPNKQFGIVCTECTHYAPIEHKTLVIKLDAVGDVLRSTSILGAIKKELPTTSITWVTRSNALAIFANNPNVDNLLAFESPETFQTLLAQEYDLLIHADASPTSAPLASLIKAKTKRGFGLSIKGKVVPFTPEAEYWLEMGVFDAVKKANTLTYQEIMHNIAGFPYEQSPIQIYLSEAEKKTTQQFLNKIDTTKIVIGLNTGAGTKWELKQWTFAGYSDLIKRLLEFPNVEVVLYGGEDERERNQQLKSQYPQVHDTGTENNLRGFFALIDACDILVTGDTMALHAAAALQKYVVCLFGPTSSNEIEDYGLITKVLPELDCLVCYKPKCDFKPNCMESISTEVVLAAITELMQKIDKK